MTLNLILCFLVLVILGGIFLAKITMQKITTEPFNTSCQGQFPPPPLTTPPSAYAQLVSPLMKMSDKNPLIETNMKNSQQAQRTFDFYSDKRICATPVAMGMCSSNDSCAQYGIGESCDGPVGSRQCVCVAKMNNDKPVIAVGGVCTENSHCITNYCADIPGQFSKMCQCPSDFIYDLDIGQCVPEFAPRSVQGGINLNIPQDLGITEHYATSRAPPKGACMTVGKITRNGADCSLGEAVTPDGFCACQLVNAGKIEENKITVGGNCDNSSQCISTGICFQSPEENRKTCKCPKGLVYQWSSESCVCPNSDQVWDVSMQKCVYPQDKHRALCNSSPNFKCSSNNDCGIGEICDPATRTCYCNSNLYSDKIHGGAKCSNDAMCASGVCEHVKGQTVCKNVPRNNLFDLAVGMFPS